MQIRISWNFFQKMNFFANDGSFLDRFRQSSTSQSAPSSSNDKNDADNIANTSANISAKCGPSFVIGKKSSVGMSLSAQFIGEKNSNKNETAITKTIKKDKPKIFEEDDQDESDVPELDPKTKETIESLALTVAETGSSAEQLAKDRNKSNPSFWFLYDKDSEAFKYYTKRLYDHRKSLGINMPKSDSLKNDRDKKPLIISPKKEVVDEPAPKRQRKSRWNESDSESAFSSSTVIGQNSAVAGHQISVVPKPSVPDDDERVIYSSSFQSVPPPPPPSSSWVPVAAPNFRVATLGVSGPSGTQDFQSTVASCSNSAGSDTTVDNSVVSTTPAEDPSLFEKQILASQLAARALAKVARAKAGLQAAPDGYDSDEDTEGGSWEHKKRAEEMQKTLDKARTLTTKASGKHFIGDFLPPEELEKFYAALNKTKTAGDGQQKSSEDYVDNKLQDDNVGFKLLQKMGWSTGKGLGANEQGIVAPVNKGKAPNDTTGLGAESSNEVTEEDDLFDVYRKRMMLAYKFRPNPLNNPRRPYY